MFISCGLSVAGRRRGMIQGDINTGYGVIGVKNMEDGRRGDRGWRVDCWGSLYG